MAILVQPDTSSQSRRLKKKLQKRGLRVIVGGNCSSEIPISSIKMTTNPRRFEPDKSSFLAMRTLEAQLEGEHWFLERARTKLRATLGLEHDEKIPTYEFETILTKNGHDSLIHIAQFYYFLSALNCTTPETIELFINSHNDEVAAKIATRELTKEAARRKTAFSKNDITNVRLTFIEFDEPIFAVSELGKLMSDQMSSGKTAALIKDLVKGGLFEQVAGPRMSGTPKTEAELDVSPLATDPRRQLVKPIPAFLQDYETSLLITHEKIMASG
ncbi:MAG: hypothetical protein V2I76_06810 [Roseobacter sp.]|jgi:hypothetical protein|nr:hypothetical protein [Roseobacter sp.]